jgi:histidinol-phosphate aminotransferase
MMKTKLTFEPTAAAQAAALAAYNDPEFLTRSIQW